MSNTLTPVQMVLIVLLIQLFSTPCWASFNIKPTTLEVPASSLTSNSTAPFYCQIETADDDNLIISWEVNGMSLSNITTTESPLPFLATLHTLFLPATLEYNGSYVQCIVLSLDDFTMVMSEPPAYLYILQDGGNNTSLPTGFSRAPVFYNSRYILAVGEVGVLFCQHCDTNVINWRLNGTQIRYEQSQNGYVIPDHEGINISYSVQNFCGLTVELTITNLSMYNETSIECIAGNRKDIIGRKGIELLVQGVLDSVSNLRRSQLEQHDIMYIWDPPFTLNLTNTNPDIAYCVHVGPAPCHMDGVTPTGSVCDPFHQCNITEPWFILQSCEFDDVLNHIQVVPRSNVERANDGAPKDHTDKFQVFTDRALSYVINIATDERIQIKITLDTQNHHGVLPRNIKLNLTTISSSLQEAVTCTTESDVDVASGELTSRSLDVLMCSSRTVRETTGLYMANIYVPNMNCSISNQTEISTHVLQNITASTTLEAGQILVSGKFIDAALPDNGRATGFIAIAYNTESKLRHYKIVRRVLGHTQQYLEAVISNLSESNYRVSVFSLQQNGLPLNKSAATARNVSNIPLAALDKNGTTNEMDPNITVNATNSNSSDCIGVKLSCTFKESVNDEDQCVAFILEPSQMVSRYGLLDLSVFMSNRPDNSTTSSVCLPQGRNYSTLIIDVFLIRDEEITGAPATVSQIHNQDKDINKHQPTALILIVACVVGAILVLLVIAMIVITVLGLVKYCNRGTKESQTTPELLSMHEKDTGDWR